MSITALGYVVIEASDLQKWQDYSRNVLGAEASIKNGALELRIDNRAMRIRVEEGPADDLSALGWETRNEEEFKSVLKRLEEQGVEYQLSEEIAASRGVKAIARFTDPAGVQCELYWGATQRSEKPFVSPTGISGFVTGSQGMGHIVISVPDAPTYESFYSRLGFCVSDYIDMPFPGGVTVPVTFMHCNPRHHSLAFASVPSPKKIIHIMLQTKNMDDVGLVYDRVCKAGVPVFMSMGRHSNDHMVSFYMHTPSGFELEYGWGAREIDDDWVVERHDAISIWGHEMKLAPGAGTHE
ncbi:VOC family protein [Marinobacter shengliensis]|uniref:VOC family protein n=1 Tax=Marinobacter shengliensis TaxID=1389223 RepID=UPI002573AD9F|nr:VOC family protein [Marinobacter shengliensis]BEH12725.1 iron-dependent extradiol dioxygenase [Marinobacter shengliensis]